MAARSAAAAITPPSASISRTRCPLPTPPIDGLHDMRPMSARLKVASATRAPRRAAAAAASTPAWPAPMTNTSNMALLSEPSRINQNHVFHVKLFAEAETSEQRVEQIFYAAAARQAVKRASCHAQF